MNIYMGSNKNISTHQVPYTVLFEQVLRIHPWVVLIYVMQKILKRSMHYFPQPSSKILPPGW